MEQGAMNGDDHINPHDLNPPVEHLELVTLGCIEMLRRRQVCMYAGPHTPVQPGDLTDFGQSLRYLRDCDALIFCAPHHDKQTAIAVIQHYLGGGDPGIEIDVDECAGICSNWIWKDDLLFPNKADNLLVDLPAPDAEPEATRPPDQQFWAHYVVLKIIGREDKLHVLHLGLSGDAAGLYFLQPHGIQVVRLIANHP